MFVEYNTDNEHNGKKIYAPSKQKNIIIYANKKNSENYREFFNFLKLNGFNINNVVPRFSYSAIDHNCLKIDAKIPQPFFHTD